jgi:hypothetical protein
MEKATDLPQIADKLSHDVVSMSGIRAYNVSGDRHRLHS